MKSKLVDPCPFVPRGLSRSLAAFYIGVGTTLFDQLVADGRMPKPKRVGGRVVWDRRAVDEFFDQLPDDASTENDVWARVRV